MTNDSPISDVIAFVSALRNRGFKVRDNQVTQIGKQIKARISFYDPDSPDKFEITINGDSPIKRLERKPRK